MIIVNAINKLLELANPISLDLGGRQYTSKGIVPVKEPVPATLTIHTLSGFADYITKNIDVLKDTPMFVHVESPVSVSLKGNFVKNSFCERPEFLTANFEPPNIQSGQYVSVESFIIGLQAFFVQTEINSTLLRVVGNLKGEQVQQFSDDGQTQAVTAKAGLASVATVPVPNPVILKPFRTFPEIEQPESLFVFRMKQQQGQAPSCGLWEADNKQWKITAVKGIAAWLQDKLPEIPIIA